ncbi:MAG: hypothetical protein AB4426_28170, partial [Xenococcaceae cyanobacterium]
MNQSEDILTDNNESLQRLVRAITLPQEFSLILACCNYEGLQEQIIENLEELLRQGGNSSKINILNRKIPELAQNLYETIQELVRDRQQPSALVVLGLEKVKDIDNLLRSANWDRNKFSESLTFPVVLWINDRILQKISKLAPDLYNSWEA